MTKSLYLKYAFIIFCLALNSGLAQTIISSNEALAKAFAEGGEYRLAAGRYEFTETLFIEQNLKLLGMGTDSTLITSSAPLVAVKTEKAITVHFEDIHFETTHAEGADVMDIKDAQLSVIACRFSDEY